MRLTEEQTNFKFLELEWPFLAKHAKERQGVRMTACHCSTSQGLSSKHPNCYGIPGK